MTSTPLGRLVLITIAGLSIVSNVLAQPEPVRNWAAPLYWQPSGYEAALARQAGQAQSEAQGLPAVGDTGTGTPDLSSGSTSPLVFVALTPCRMMDTRGYDATFTGIYGPPALVANGSRSLPVAGVTAGYCSVPSTAQAVSINVTLWPNAGSPVSYLTIWPTGGTFPSVSTLNDTTGIQGVNNGAVAALGTGGAFSFYVTNATNLFIDVNGYYLPPSALALGAGTAAAPSLTFGTDTTSGLYSAGAGSVEIAAGGVQKVQVSSTGLSVAGNLDFSNALTQSGATLLQASSLNGNTALGLGAWAAPTTAQAGTAVGSHALNAITTGNNNTAVGYYALGSDSTGANNTAVGQSALGFSTAGDETAVGAQALAFNTTGSYNTAVGFDALEDNQTGTYNTAVGYEALQAQTSANYNTALGYNAMANAANGSANTALGYGAGFLMTTGTYNTFTGYLAGNNPITGTDNSGLGAFTGYNLTSGAGNIMVGYDAGYSLTTGNYNIDIGNTGLSADSGVIRIGASGNQTATYIAGIYNNNTGGNYVYVNSNGQLSSLSSSRRFKQDIRDMGDTTDAVMGLRPVRFRYKAHGPDGPEQYGLIAEEVQEVAPDLVGRGQDGQIDSVRYDRVNVMLLNEVQSQRRLIESQKDQLRTQGERLQSQRQEFTDLVRQLESRLAELENRVK